jgi:hypothetical protein
VAARPDERLGGKRDCDIEDATDVWTEEPLGCHAHDRERDAFDRERAADNAWISAEAALPEPVGEHQHLRLA